jgi:putative transposase
MSTRPDIRTGRHCVFACHAHLVFITKYRRDVFTDEILARCHEVMAAVCADFGAELIEFNGEHDHVHLLINFPPTIQLSRLVNSLKGVSSRMLRKEYGSHLSTKLWGGHLWARSYYIGTAGGAPLHTITDYIRNQQRPSRTITHQGSNPTPEGVGTPP